MNKLEGANIPTGVMTHRIMSNNNLSNEINNEIKKDEVMEEKEIKNTNLDESNIKNELDEKRLIENNNNKRNLSPEDKKDIDQMNNVELNEIGQKIINKDPDEMHADLQKFINKIKSKSEEDKENCQNRNDDMVENPTSEMNKELLSPNKQFIEQDSNLINSTSKDPRPNALTHANTFRENN